MILNHLETSLRELFVDYKFNIMTMMSNIIQTFYFREFIVFLLEFIKFVFFKEYAKLIVKD